MSETVLGVDNAKSGICYLYGWMVRMPFKRACALPFFLKKSGLTAVYSETTVKQALLYT